MPDHILGTLLVEAAGIAFYSTVLEKLTPGKVTHGLRLIIDEKRLHLEFMRDLLVGTTPSLPPASLRHLRRLRGRLVLTLLLTHLLAHARFFRPPIDVPNATVRRRVMTEIEASLSTVPELALAG